MLLGDGDIDPSGSCRSSLAPVVSSLPSGSQSMEYPIGKLGGLNAPMGVISPVQAILQDVVPLSEADADRGDPVHALDGEIGRVQGLLVDPDDHRVTHVLLEEGHLWGRKKVSIPVSAVTGVENGIQLSLTKKQVEDLPPAD